MRRPYATALAAAILAAVTAAAKAQFLSPLAKARADFATSVHLPTLAGWPAPRPPEDAGLALVHYDSPVGPLPAYLTPDPGDGRRHPAIVWIHGNDCNTLGEGAWKPAPRDRDQSAAAYRKAGIVTLYPSLRGGNDNPGAREAFYGEVADVLAAADWLSRLPWVDPARIYLGGHSTGGTLALLVAEASPRFRAVIAFGPVASPSTYDSAFLGIDLKRLPDRRELALRSPIAWLQGVRSRTLVLAGTEQDNLVPLQEMQARNTNPKVSFVTVTRASHLGILAPANEVFARKILQDTGPDAALAATAEEIAAAGLAR